jgi:hypothetical protein
MSKERERRGQLALELDCSGYQATGQTFAPTPGGASGLFSCSVGPLPQETIAALDRAAHEHGRVRLLFGGRPVLLELVTLERKGAQRVRIVGQVVTPPAAQTGD